MGTIKRTLRIDDDLEERLVKAARRAGLTVSELLRLGARSQCDKILNRRRFHPQLVDVIGSVRSSGGHDARFLKSEVSAIMARRHSLATGSTPR